MKQRSDKYNGENSVYFLIDESKYIRTKKMRRVKPIMQTIK
jgi:hypothetical protein